MCFIKQYRLNLSFTLEELQVRSSLDFQHVVFYGISFYFFRVFVRVGKHHVLFGEYYYEAKTACDLLKKCFVLIGMSNAQFCILFATIVTETFTLNFLPIPKWEISNNVWIKLTKHRMYWQFLYRRFQRYFFCFYIECEIRNSQKTNDTMMPSWFLFFLRNSFPRIQLCKIRRFLRVR